MSGWVNKWGATCLTVGGGLGVGVKEKKNRLEGRLLHILCMSFCSSVVLEYSKLHTGYIVTSTWRFCSQGNVAHHFLLGSQKKKQEGRAKAISGVIPLCSLTSVCFTLFLKLFGLTSKLWPKVREPYTLSNRSIIITLTKVTTEANKISHLLHVLPLTTYIYWTQIPVLGYILILARTSHAPCFISFGPPGPYWSIAIAIPRAIGQTNSFQLQLA